jgi:hypothetical protein
MSVVETLMWKFKVHVSQGQPGFCEIETYTSKWFDTFEAVFRAYMSFKPQHHWAQLRNVIHEIIVFKDAHGIKHYHQATRGSIAWNDRSEVLLGVTEAEVDRIVASVVARR